MVRDIRREEQRHTEGIRISIQQEDGKEERPIVPWREWTSIGRS